MNDEKDKILGKLYDEGRQLQYEIQRAGNCSNGFLVNDKQRCAFHYDKGGVMACAEKYSDCPLTKGDTK